MKKAAAGNNTNSLFLLYSLGTRRFVATFTLSLFKYPVQPPLTAIGLEDHTGP